MGRHRNRLPLHFCCWAASSLGSLAEPAPCSVLMSHHSLPQKYCTICKLCISSMCLQQILTTKSPGLSFLPISNLQLFSMRESLLNLICKITLLLPLMRVCNHKEAGEIQTSKLCLSVLTRCASLSEWNNTESLKRQIPQNQACNIRQYNAI